MKKYLFLILLFWVNFTLGQNVNFTVHAPKVVTQNERFNLTFKINTNASNFKPPSLSDFHASGPSTQTESSFQSINGKVTRKISLSYVYRLQAKNTGKFTINPAKITVNGNTYKTNPITIEVIKGSGKANHSKNAISATAKKEANDISSSDLYAAVVISKPSVYQGEHLVATLKIYSRLQLVGLGEIQPPTFNGFWSQEIETPSNITLKRENINGKIYNTGILKKVLLFPQRSGQIKIEPAEIEVAYRKRVKPRSFFDSGFREEQVKLKSSSKVINVKPLPTTKPVGFNGAVGKFDMDVEIDKQELKTNDALNLVITISGNGNLKLIDPLAVDFPSDFEVYDPETKTNIHTSSGGASGKVSFQYLAIPRHAGDFTIPPIAFSYFDTESKSYKTIRSKKYKVHVEKGEGESSVATVRGYNKEDIEIIGKDIRYIKRQAFNLHKKGNYFFGSPAFYSLTGAPALVFIGLFFIRRKRIKENADIARKRSRQANKISRKRLKKAEKALKSGQKEIFYDEMLHALWGYLSDKLSIPLSELSRENATENLSSHHVDQQTVNDFIELLDTCEYAKYAPPTESGQMDLVYGKASEIINKLENKI